MQKWCDRDSVWYFFPKSWCSSRLPSNRERQLALACDRKWTLCIYVTFRDFYASVRQVCVFVASPQVSVWGKRTSVRTWKSKSLPLGTRASHIVRFANLSRLVFIAAGWRGGNFRYWRRRCCIVLMEPFSRVSLYSFLISLAETEGCSCTARLRVLWRSIRIP